MKLYRINYNHQDYGRCIAWAGSRLRAEADCKDIRKSGVDDSPEIKEVVNFPTSKSMLIAWLNNNFTRDNG